ncbi:hypothetical protein C8F01DRAFT_1177738 [Mycena amicta]|nr:hypothetical protein C8F01DRAFT_1177738 [Mycena amicta]
MTDSVPSEIWLEILTALPKWSVSSVALTNRRFAALARSFLFTHFHYRLHEDANAQEILDRLQFWLSNEIAPWVRVCRISWPSWPLARSKNIETLSQLLDALFDRIHVLVRLRCVELRWIDLQNNHLEKLHRIPTLVELYVNACTFSSPSHTAASAPIQNSTFRRARIHNFTFVNEGKETMLPWSRFLSSTHLRSLVLVYHTPWIVNRETLPQFPQVTSLRMSLLSPTLNFAGVLNVGELLSRLPALETLDLYANVSSENRVLPALRCAITDGCAQSAGSLKWVQVPLLLTPGILSLETTALTHLVIRPEFDHQSSPEELLRVLSPSATITSLQFRLSHMDLDALARIVGHFPFLKELRADVAPDYALFYCLPNPPPTYDPVSLFTAIPESGVFPSNFSALFISYAAQPPGTASDRGPIDVDVLRSAYVARIPGLSSLWLQGDSFMLVWRKGGEVYGEDWLAGDDAEELARSARRRPSLYMWWESREFYM